MAKRTKSEYGHDGAEPKDEAQTPLSPRAETEAEVVTEVGKS